MRRRDVLAGFMSAVALPPFGVVAQPARAETQTQLIGILNARSLADVSGDIEAFRRGLRQLGFLEGTNVSFLTYFADGQYDRLPGLAQELVRKDVSVILAGGGAPAVSEAKKATDRIPIVFTIGNDPLAFGLVSHFNRPEANITGVYIATTALDTKRLQILAEALPNARALAALVNDKNPTFRKQADDLNAAATALNRDLLILAAHDLAGIEAAFSTLQQKGLGALLVASDPYLNETELVWRLAQRYRVAVVSLWRTGPEAGGLLSYGTSLNDAYQLAGTYVGRILKGDKVSDLPVQQSTKVRLVINIKVAKALGLNLPITLLGRADEVIE